MDGWISAAASPFRRRLTADWPDLLQDIRLELFKCLQKASWRGEARLKTYVWRVAGHTCLDAIRRVRRRPPPDELDDEAPLPSGDPSPLDRVIDLDRANVLLTALDAVPQDCRQLWDGILAGLSYRELSERMAISEGTLRVRAHRCRKRALEVLTGNAATRRAAQA
jgi:RNA polymerase sigma factor (sigma-70 family)